MPKQMILSRPTVAERSKTPVLLISWMWSRGRISVSTISFELRKNDLSFRKNEACRVESAPNSIQLSERRMVIGSSSKADCTKSSSKNDHPKQMKKRKGFETTDFIRMWRHLSNINCINM